MVVAGMQHMIGSCVVGPERVPRGQVQMAPRHLEARPWWDWHDRKRRQASIQRMNTRLQS
jgi:hypothetical protein